MAHLIRLRSFGAAVRPQLPALAGFAAPFVLVVYLALEAGGYELVTRSELGIVAWWAILLGVTTGLLPVIRVTRASWVVLAILAGLVAWTALATLTWTQSTEHSVIELSRVVTLLGFLLLLTLLQGKEGLRRSVAAVGAAVTLVAVVALAARFHPTWFNIAELPENYPKARLSYPLGYWNGLATLMAMGAAVLLWSASSGRSAAGRALATGAIPLLILAGFMTASRGGAIELAAMLAFLFIVFPKRLTLLPPITLATIGSMVLIGLISSRPELRDNLGGVAGTQGNEMTWLTVVVVLLVTGASYLVDTRVIGRIIRVPEIRREVTVRFGQVVAAVTLVVVVAAVVSGFAGDRWNEFEQPMAVNTTVDRFSNFNSGERYDQWVAAIDAGQSKVLTGIGPGAYEYWWARNGNGPGFVRDAHSLYLEGFAELGLVGFILVLALVLVPIGYATRRAIRPGPDERRTLFAAAGAGMVVFAVAAGIDWAWELTVLPATFLVLVAASSGPDAETRRGRKNSRTFRLPLSFSESSWIAAGSAVALVLVAVPLFGTKLVQESQTLYRQGDLSGSLEKANQARRVQPWSATASTQVAQLELVAGNLDGAAAAARDAANEDPYSWKTWYLVARIANLQDDPEQARQALEKVIELHRDDSDPS